MTEVEMFDSAGCGLQLLEVEGKLFPRFPVDKVINYRNVPLRQDDVILCAYPKSGTHWLWEVTMMLVNHKAETIPFKKSLNMLEYGSADDFTSIPSPRVLNTHVLYDALPRDCLALKTRLVFVARNPKDVSVSYYHHHCKLGKYYGYSGAFGDWFRDLFLPGKVDYGSWFDYTLTWEKAIHGDVSNPIHVIMYEDMKEDPVRETRRLAEFLGLTLAPELIEEIAHKCSFSNMAVDKKAFQEHAEIMFRKGQVGDWKNTLTVAQSEAWDAAMDERMKDSKFKFRFTL